jgi:serine/threonine protein kinase
VKSKTRRRSRSLNRGKRGRTYRKNSNRRARSLEPYINNSEEIGSGGFGIVSRPPAKCDSFLNKNFNQNALRAAYYGNPNYISKLTEYSSAERELEIGIAIKDVIPNYEDYFCLVEFICNAPASKSISLGGDDYNAYAISPYCGITLEDYIRSDINAPINIFVLCYLVPSLQYMIIGLQTMHKYHIYHKDIHEGNILYDSDSGLMRLIDFGLSDDQRNIKNDNHPAIINEELHDLDMLVEYVIEPLINFLLYSLISTESVHRKYPYIEDFYHELKRFKQVMNSMMNPKNKNKYENVTDNEEKLVRLLNVVYQFKQIKSVDEIEKQYNNNNNK